MNNIDLIHDKTRDFTQIIIRALLLEGSRKELKNMDLGTPTDAYQLTSFMEASLN